MIITYPEMDSLIVVIFNKPDDQVQEKLIHISIDINTTVLILKELVRLALKVPLQEQQLSIDDVILDNDNDYILTRLLASPSNTREVIITTDYNGQKSVRLAISSQSSTLDEYVDIDNDTYPSDLYIVPTVITSSII